MSEARRGWRRLAAEDGFVGGFEALPFGFLVLVAGMLLVVNAWAVFDSHLAAGAAAREAVRAFVEAGDEATAHDEGLRAAREAIAGHGKDAGRMSLVWEGALLRRCQEVRARVTYDVPLVAVPWIGAFGGGLLSTTAVHTEVVDPYRRGLPTDGFDAGSCSGG